MYPLLEIKSLSISFEQDGNNTKAVQDISFLVNRGEITALVGESGSGKSVTALSVLQLLPGQALAHGEILFSQDGKKQASLNNMPSKLIQTIRGNKIAMIFQEPMTSLNPVLTCGYQVMESVIRHQKLTAKEARLKCIRLFEEVELPQPSDMFNRYPHQISGGQKQRVMIAMAMSCNPDLLIADEPTTALDVRVQKKILQLIKKLQQQHHMGVLLITHDLGLVADIAEELIVLYQGHIIERGKALTVLKDPSHPYTRALLACRPVAGSKGKKLAVLDNKPDETSKEFIMNKGLQVVAGNNEKKILLSVRDLKVYFPSGKNFIGKPTGYTRAVDGVSFEVNKGEITGLVGESGCGKTTLGRAILRLIEPTAGKIFLGDKELTDMNNRELRFIRKDLQIVFQDPYGSLNPRITIGTAIQEALKVHGIYDTPSIRKEAVIDMLEKVQLSADHYNRYPHQFSGGQRQRICIARALVLDPSFLVFDESVSALDVSAQAGILNLVNELKAAFQFTAIFISHDLSVVHYISDRILVMNKGKIVESGNANEIYFEPKEDYTKQLIDAIPGKMII